MNHLFIHSFIALSAVEFQWNPSIYFFPRCWHCRLFSSKDASNISLADTRVACVQDKVIVINRKKGLCLGQYISLEE